MRCSKKFWRLLAEAIVIYDKREKERKMQALERKSKMTYYAHKLFEGVYTILDNERIIARYNLNTHELWTYSSRIPIEQLKKFHEVCQLIEEKEHV